MVGMGKWPRGGPLRDAHADGLSNPVRSARGEGLCLGVSQEVSCDEVVVSDMSEREGDADCSSNEESELRDFIGWGWYKREKGLRSGRGVRDQDGQGGGEQGGKRNGMSDVRRGW